MSNESKTLFSFLKETNRLDHLWSRSIEIPKFPCFLLPLCTIHVYDDVVLGKLTKWRNDHVLVYPTQFVATVSSTQNWITKCILQNPSRILFLIVDNNNKYIGHLGFSNSLNEGKSVELDNVLRGCSLYPGLMSASVETLIKWADDTFFPDNIYLQVLSDNHHAIKFYTSLGFSESKITPLSKTEDKENQRIIYVKSNKASSDKYLIKMDRSQSRCITKPESVILTAGPSISQKEVSYTLDAVSHGWNNQHRFYIDQFEAAFSKYLDVKHSLNTGHCTNAMHLALAALGIKAGDEVIVPDLTWVATATAILYVGAIPIFADVEMNSWCIDPESIETLITERTKAIMPVHLYGHPARMDQIVKIAKKYGLYIIEDAAPAIGAECFGQKVGTFGDFAAYSFQGAKLLVTGEGGMLVTNSKELYDRVWSLWNLGTLPGTFWAIEKGFKSRMSNLQAALGLAQLERVDELIAAKRRIFKWYSDELKNVEEVQLNYQCDWANSIYWMTSIVITEKSKVSRDQMREELKLRHIDTRPIFPAISQYSFWPQQQDPQPNALYLGNNGINLPSGVCLRQSQIIYICNSIKDILCS